MLFSLRIFTKNIKKIKNGVIDLHYRGILNKHLNACFLGTFECRRKRQVNNAPK